jgi:fumarate hydratase class I
MADILKKLSQYPIKTRLKLNGTLIVARDIAHAKIKELDAGKPMPDYFKTSLLCWSCKTPEGMPSGRPTTAGRMDVYVENSKNMAEAYDYAKGNRTKQVTDACKTYGGFT